jgi:ribosome-binding factor A
VNRRAGSSGGRVPRLNGVLREVISEAIGALSDPRVELVTVTGVTTTLDLEHATVHVQVHGTDARRARALAGLEQARGVLQGRIGRELRLRRVPYLHFSYDPSLDESMRVEELLGQYEPVDLDEEAGRSERKRHRDRSVLRSDRPTAAGGSTAVPDDP